MFVTPTHLNNRWIHVAAYVLMFQLGGEKAPIYINSFWYVTFFLFSWHLDIHNYKSPGFLACVMWGIWRPGIVSPCQPVLYLSLHVSRCLGEDSQGWNKRILRNKGLRAGLIKGKQWVFICPDHKGPRLFLGGVRDRLSSHNWRRVDPNKPILFVRVRFLATIPKVPSKPPPQKKNMSPVKSCRYIQHRRMQNY